MFLLWHLLPLALSLCTSEKSLALGSLYPCKNFFRTFVEPLLSSVFLALIQSK